MSDATKAAGVTGFFNQIAAPLIVLGIPSLGAAMWDMSNRLVRVETTLDLRASDHTLVTDLAQKVEGLEREVEALKK